MGVMNRIRIGAEICERQGRVSLATDQGSRMVTEKILATGEAQVTTVAAAMRGQGSMSLLARLSTSTGSAFAPIDGVFRDSN